MTDSENKDSIGLPTAAIEVISKEKNSRSFYYPDMVDIVESRDKYKYNELVRRSDVKALIRDKIEDNSGDTVIQNTKLAAFEDLLEEVEQ